MARGAGSNDIMMNLFKEYKSITDGQFKHYMAQKINEYPYSQREIDGPSVRQI